MKIACKYLILLILLSINISCKKEGIVEPSTTDLPLITNFAPVILTTSSIVLSGKIDLRRSDSASIYFEYGLTNSYGLKTPVQKISSSGTFSARIINLNPETLYHWRIYCKAPDVITSNDTTFVTILQPIVTSLPLGNLTLTSATLTGQVDLQGRDSVSVYFEYGLTSSYGSKSPEQFITTSGIFNATINNLKPATTYHWRIYCKPNDGNSDITTWDSTFTTFFLPSITLLTISNLTMTGVILSGQIDLHGRASASFYFEYGLTASYGTSSPEQTIYSSGIFNLTLNNLKQKTTYHWRIYCKTTDGDISSSDNTFTTYFLPTITGLTLNNLINTSVYISGQIDLHGRSNASIYVEYGETGSYGSRGPEQQITSSGTFNITLNNLTPATKYHSRIYCKTTDGDITSYDMVFITLIEFIYPLNIGQTWTYNYNLFYEDIFSGIIGYVEVRNGIRIWKVVSNYSAGDSTIYNLTCTTRDTVIRSNVNTPADTSYEEKLIPFTIVVSPYLIKVNLKNTVNIETDNPPIPRFVTAGTTQIKFGVILYINGTGLYGYAISYACNSYAWYERLQLLQ
jgi:hypothetical protein